MYIHYNAGAGYKAWQQMAVVSPGLLVTVPKRSKDAHRRFELGLGEWTESSEDEKENDPPAPRNKLKLTLEKPKERWHFLTEVAEPRFHSMKYKNTHISINQGHSLISEQREDLGEFCYILMTKLGRMLIAA